MEFFSFQSYNECFISDVGQILFSLARSFAAHHEKRFVLAFFKVSVDHDLFDNLESGKSRFLFWKKVSKKSWILDLKSVLTHQIVILTSEYLLPSLVGFSPFSYSFILAKRSTKKNCNKEWHKHIWYVHICRCVTVNICHIRYGFMSAQELSSTDWTWPLCYVRVS